VASAKEIKTARKAVEKQLKTLNKVYEKLAGENPLDSTSSKFQAQISVIKDALPELQEAVESLEAMFEEPPA
jgi:CCR4-NOT transcriptional regulation complex NOT5 subunit